MGKVELEVVEGGRRMGMVMAARWRRRVGWSRLASRLLGREEVLKREEERVAAAVPLGGIRGVW